MEWIGWYSFILGAFVLGTFLNVLFLPSPPRNTSLKNMPLVSVLIPMRNEFRNVQGLVAALKKQNYNHFEVLILDDESTDGTFEALQMAISQDMRFRVIKGSVKPEGWVGKVHACHQLSGQARGEYLFFVDADVRLTPDAISHSLSMMQQKKIALLSGFSRFVLPTWLNKLLVPMQHFIVLFHLPIALANYTKWPAATAAHGGFMFFDRSAYEAIGGHGAVRSEIVEDVALARRIKQHGRRMWLVNVTRFASCTMYSTNQEVWSGFAKNIFNGIGRSTSFAISIIFFYSLFYVAPGVLFLIGLLVEQQLLLLPYFLICLQAALVYVKTREPIGLAFVMPASALAFVTLLGYAVVQAKNGKPVEWKGRFYT